MRTSLVLVLLALTACAGRQKVDNLPDTPETRAILAVVDSYREAMERRDVDTLLSLASPDYHEDMGTPEPEDDLSHAQLRQKLESDFEKIRNLRLDLQVLDLEMGDKGLTAKLSYRFDLRYQLALPSGEKWFNALDVDQMLLQRDDEGWKVLAGL